MGILFISCSLISNSTKNNTIMSEIIKQISATIRLAIITGSLVFGITVQATTQTSKPVPTQSADSLVSIKIMVNGLACPFCAFGLEKKIKKIDGATDLFIEINEGYVTFDVPADKNPSEEELKKVVKEAGFAAEKIEYSNEPFDTKSKGN